MNVIEEVKRKGIIHGIRKILGDRVDVKKAKATLSEANKKIKNLETNIADKEEAIQQLTNSRNTARILAGAGLTAGGAGIAYGATKKPLIVVNGGEK